MKSATPPSGMRTNLPSFTYRMRRSRTQRSMKRTDTESASAASALVSNRSRPGLPPRVRRAGPPLARSTARLDRALTHSYRVSASQSAPKKFPHVPNDVVVKFSSHTPAPLGSCTWERSVGGRWIAPTGVTIESVSGAERAIRSHVRQFFEGHTIDVVKSVPGPVRQRVPEFDVLRVGPGPRLGVWTFVSRGCWQAIHHDEHGLEFAICTPTNTPRAVELLAMTAYYHAGQVSQRLDVGHTVPVGEPWLPGATCDHLLVSIPYIFGPNFETCRWKGGHARLLWLLPITSVERDFKVEHGLEALEQRFESESVDYPNPARRSVVG